MPVSTRGKRRKPAPKRPARYLVIDGDAIIFRCRSFHRAIKFLATEKRGSLYGVLVDGTAVHPRTERIVRECELT